MVENKEVLHLQKQIKEGDGAKMNSPAKNAAQQMAI